MRVIIALIVLLFAAQVAAEALSETQYEYLFTRWVSQHGKHYQHDEYFYRYGIWRVNYETIVSHNARNSSFTMGMNQFGDLTRAEFRATYLGYRSSDRARDFNGPHQNVGAPLDAVDWRNKNAVTAVKNQQQCGSCWAFSTTGSVEGAWALAKGHLISLSEQQLVDCSNAQGNDGCSGGLMDNAFQYIISNNGIGTEADYPYVATDGHPCKASTSVATISKFTDVIPNNETDLLRAANIGPVSVAIEADQAVFQFYSGGVLDDPSCGTTLDHGVLVAGYGTDGKDYWLVKNSWGATWGESGYVRLARDKNTCGISQDPSYPTV
jgi:hypothetical protein